MKRLLYLVLALFLLAGCGGGGNGDKKSPGEIKPGGGDASTPATLQSIAISTGDFSLPAGSRQILKVKGLYSDGTTIDISKSVQWAVEETGAVEYEKTDTGLIVKGLTSGRSSSIDAEVDGKSAAVVVTVTDAYLQQIDVTPRESVLPEGRKRSFQAAGTYSDDTVRDITGEVSWYSSDDTKAIIVESGFDNGGVASALAEGDVQITAELEGLQATANLTIVGPHPEAIEISSPYIKLPREMELPLGMEVQLKVTGIFSGEEYDVTDSVEWSSSEEKIASVESCGRVSADFPGEAEITAKYRLESDDGYLEDTMNLTVVEAELVKFLLAPGELDLIPGHTQAIQAYAYYTNGFVYNITSLAKWISSDSEVASVTPSGLVTGIAAGDADISATYEGQKGTAAIKVTEVEPVRLEIISEKTELTVGESVQFKAECLFSDGSRVDVTHSASWSILNDADDVAYVEKLENRGMVHALAVGEAELQVVWKDVEPAFIPISVK